MEATEQILKEAGLKILAMYDDMTRNYPRSESERIVFVVGKR